MQGCLPDFQMIGALFFAGLAQLRIVQQNILDRHVVFYSDYRVLRPVGLHCIVKALLRPFLSRGKLSCDRFFAGIPA